MDINPLHLLGLQHILTMQMYRLCVDRGLVIIQAFGSGTFHENYLLPRRIPL